MTSDDRPDAAADSDGARAADEATAGAGTDTADGDRPDASDEDRPGATDGEHPGVADGGVDAGTRATDGDGTEAGHANGGPEDPDMDDLLAKLQRLEETVDTQQERTKVRQTIALVERMPGSSAFKEHISKYTTRDVAEGFAGSVLFSLPMLVEGGVFEIATWFASVWVGPIPVFFVANVVFVVAMTTGLLYGADFRQVRIRNPILGVIPRRLVGVLGVSLLATVLTMVMWGRLFEEGPVTGFEVASRISVVWAVGAFGAALGDILPGESVGRDVSEHVDDLQEAMGFDGDDGPAR